ncbi:MAG: 5'/3'-nucleotidase SurE, partial [Actinomycetota bacterium]
VLVAAPDHEASGSGAAMTATQDGGRIVIAVRELPGLPSVRAYAVPAAPAFIAFTAVRAAFGPQPGLLLSGINLGPNTGKAIVHSGTVGAAMTAASHGRRAAAFSLDAPGPAGDLHWETAEAVAAQIIPVLTDLPRGQLLNVNVPNVPPARLRGIRQGSLAETGTVEIAVTYKGDEFLQVTMAAAEPAAAGTDSALLAGGYASVTSLAPVWELAAPWLPWPPGDAQEIR